MTPKSHPKITQSQLKKLPQKTSPKKTAPGGYLSSTLVITILLSSASVVIIFSWISLLFIFNPAQISWVNQLLPEWAQIPLGKIDHPQTLKQIQISLSEQKLLVGEAISLDGAAFNSFLLPVFHQLPNCQTDCQALVELRVYQQSVNLELSQKRESYYLLVNQLSINGLEESEVTAPYGEVILDLNKHSSQPRLPLTEIKAFGQAAPHPDRWFYLQGNHRQGERPIAYGLVVYYNPQEKQLQQMISWKSASGQPPRWQQVVSNNTKELVIDQTVGLEPQLQVYQVKSSNLVPDSPQIEEINLKIPAIEDFDYRNALLLARNGLWTSALVRMKSIQKQLKSSLTAAAQAQIHLINLHSQLTQIQAEKVWASPSEQVLADLIDCRWEKAIEVFTASTENLQEIATLLKKDQGHLTQRVNVASSLDPNNRGVLAWRTLILTVNQGEERANSWLQKQPQISPATLSYIQNILARFSNEMIEPHSSQIIGGVKQIDKVNYSDWIPIDPKSNLTIPNEQVWYEVDVSTFNNGKVWLNHPFTSLKLPKAELSQFFTKILGITADQTIQLVIWLADGNEQITTATIKAVELQDGTLHLLAAGSPITAEPDLLHQPQPLAITDTTLEWVQPSPITVHELYQKNPRWLEMVLPGVWRSLQQSGDISPGLIPNFPQIAQQMADWPVQSINLTDQDQPDLVMTISLPAIASLAQSSSRTVKQTPELSQPRTLIISHNGQIIYSDFAKNSPQRLIALAKINNSDSLALLVEDAGKYSLERWSTTNQRFE